MHFNVSLQNPQPVVLVHSPQSVIEEHMGGGQVPDCVTSGRREPEAKLTDPTDPTDPPDPPEPDPGFA